MSEAKFRTLVTDGKRRESASPRGDNVRGRTSCVPHGQVVVQSTGVAAGPHRPADHGRAEGVR